MALLLVAVLSLFAFALAFQAGGAKAAAANSHGTLTRISNSRTIPTGLLPNIGTIACTNQTDMPAGPQCPGNSQGDADASDQGNGPPATAGMPHVSTAGMGDSGTQLANFNGVSDDDTHTASGFHDTPPDQGLCVGAAGPLEASGLQLGVSPGTSVVLEAVNSAWTVYSTSGAVLHGPDSLVNLFHDPFADGDVSCNYDPATNTYFFSEIGVLLTGTDAGNVGTDLAVMSPSGYAPYQIDTSQNANCFPDFPQNGFDDNAFYLTINEFCGPNEDFQGVSMWAISKSDLVSLGSPGFVEFDNPALTPGDPIFGLRPAIGDGTSTEYLMNGQFDTNIESSLGLWTVTGDQNIDSNPGSVTLTGRTINSERYAFPVDAASTGDGSVTNGDITSEPFLNPDDFRLEQVQFLNGHLYTSLDSAMIVNGGKSPVDGAAWFDVDAAKGKVAQQGYLGLSGINLLYPSILRAGSGTLTLDFSMTSPTLDPSTGYSQSSSTAGKFGPVHLTGLGSGPHQSFSDILFDEARWGDYSAIVLDPSSGNVWTADEYTVPTAGPVVDNWGTRVWALSR